MWHSVPALRSADGLEINCKPNFFKCIQYMKKRVFKYYLVKTSYNKQ